MDPQYSQEEEKHMEPVDVLHHLNDDEDNDSMPELISADVSDDSSVESEQPSFRNTTPHRYYPQTIGIITHILLLLLLLLYYYYKKGLLITIIIIKGGRFGIIIRFQLLVTHMKI